MSDGIPPSRSRTLPTPTEHPVIEMGASGSVMMAIVPTPLELPGSGGGGGNCGEPVEAPSVLPLAYRHLSHFPVLAKVARGPIKPHPNERITQ